MDLLESNTHSFIVKVWLEETAEEAGQVVWRGRITHVPGGECRYVKELDGVTAFITPYLESMGVKFGSWRRVRDGLKQVRARLGRTLLGWPQKCLGTKEIPKERRTDHV